MLLVAGIIRLLFGVIDQPNQSLNRLTTGINCCLVTVIALLKEHYTSQIYHYHVENDRHSYSNLYSWNVTAVDLESVKNTR